MEMHPPRTQPGPDTPNGAASHRPAHRELGRTAGPPKYPAANATWALKCGISESAIHENVRLRGGFRFPEAKQGGVVAFQGTSNPQGGPPSGVGVVMPL